jgi:hypothetical protein
MAIHSIDSELHLQDKEMLFFPIGYISSCWIVPTDEDRFISLRGYILRTVYCQNLDGPVLDRYYKD